MDRFLFVFLSTIFFMTFLGGVNSSIELKDAATRKESNSIDFWELRKLDPIAIDKLTIQMLFSPRFTFIHLRLKNPAALEALGIDSSGIMFYVKLICMPRLFTLFTLLRLPSENTTLLWWFLFLQIIQIVFLVMSLRKGVVRGLFGEAIQTMLCPVSGLMVALYHSAFHRLGAEGTSKLFFFAELPIVSFITMFGFSSLTSIIIGVFLLFAVLRRKRRAKKLHNMSQAAEMDRLLSRGLEESHAAFASSSPPTTSQSPITPPAAKVVETVSLTKSGGAKKDVATFSLIDDSDSESDTDLETVKKTN